jgi:hypothetical protein
MAGEGDAMSTSVYGGLVAAVVVCVCVCVCVCVVVVVGGGGGTKNDV